MRRGSRGREEGWGGGMEKGRMEMWEMWEMCGCVDVMDVLDGDTPLRSRMKKYIHCCYGYE